MAKIISVNELLNAKLIIPGYQRPYKWTLRNVDDLLNDIANAIFDAGKHGTEFRYRIGTIIVNPNSKGCLDIVDGQQRIVTLSLLKKYLVPTFQNKILKQPFTNKITQNNIHDNYMYIREWFSLREHDKKDFIRALADILEVVFISVEEVSAAFQLFDSQNARGKELDPHDLLKAYHLREMKRYPYEMEHAVTKWEAKKTKEIKELFDLYLYPIWNWSRGIKSRPFSVKEIDTYKGIGEDTQYTYARRAGKAMPYFQITEPFIAGNDFFEMVDHYMLLLQDVKKEIKNNSAFETIKLILGEDKDDGAEKGSVGFRYAKNLFYCALLCYYDKFHLFDEMAVKKLFTWAFMLRVDLENLGFDSINKYAIGGEAISRYTNNIPVFLRISMARLHNEISGIQVTVRHDGNGDMNKERSEVYSCLMKMNGLAGDSDE